MSNRRCKYRFGELTVGGEPLVIAKPEDLELRRFEHRAREAARMFALSRGWRITTRISHDPVAVIVERTA